MYTSTVFKVIKHHLPEVHCYANDTQLCMSLKPDDDNTQGQVVQSWVNITQG